MWMLRFAIGRASSSSIRMAMWVIKLVLRLLISNFQHWCFHWRIWHCSWLTKCWPVWISVQGGASEDATAHFFTLTSVSSLNMPDSLIFVFFAEHTSLNPCLFTAGWIKVEDGKVQWCRDWLRKQCRYIDCHYLHIPRHFVQRDGAKYRQAPCFSTTKNGQ